jgi:DNA-binding NtrC family response regulator
VVASTSRDLADAVSQGRFRADLYYCLRAFTMVLPPLRERREDIPLLAEHFLRRSVDRYRFQPTTLTPAALSALQEYHWPRNVRELEQVIAVAMHEAQGSPIQPQYLGLAAVPKPGPALNPGSWPTLDAHQRQYIAEVLPHTHGVVKGPHGAARILAINESTLRSRMRRLGLPRKARPC